MNHMTNTTTPTTTTPVAGTPTLSVAVDTHLKAYCEPDPATTGRTAGRRLGSDRSLVRPALRR